MTERVVMSTIETAAKTKDGMPDRLCRARGLDAKGGKIAAVIFVNDVDEGRFREIDQFGGR
jgi:hypothetical protein